MSANDIRSKEALIQITVDSVRRGTVKVKDLSIKPNTDRNMTQYPGEKRKSSDLSVNGFDVSFKANARAAFKLWDRLPGRKKKPEPPSPPSQ